MRALIAADIPLPATRYLRSGSGPVANNRVELAPRHRNRLDQAGGDRGGRQVIQCRTVVHGFSPVSVGPLLPATRATEMPREPRRDRRPAGRSKSLNR